MTRWQKSIETGKPFQMEFPLRGADGVFRTFLTRVEPILDSDSQVVRWCGTNTDVDEMRQYRDERELLLLKAIEARRQASDLSVQLTEERDKLRAANELLQASNADLLLSGNRLREEQEVQAQIAHYLRAANRSAAQISLADSAAEATTILLDLLVKTFRAQSAGIWEYDSSNRSTLRVMADYRLSPASSMIEPSLDIRYNSFKLCWVARNGQPYAGVVQDGDLQFDHAWFRQNGLSYAAIYPFSSRDRVDGILAYFGDVALPTAASEVLETVSTVYGSHLESLRRERAVFQALRLD